MVPDRRDVPILVEKVAALAEAPGQARIFDETLHPGGERIGRAGPEQQAVDFVADVFGHAAHIGCNRRNPRLLRFVEYEGRILDPYGGNDDGVDPVEHVAHDLPVTVFGEPFHALRLSVRKVPGQGLERLRVLASRAAPDTQDGVSLHAAERANQIVDALRGDMRADIAEDERFFGRSLSPAQPRAIEAVIQVNQFAIRKPEFIAVAVAQIPRRRHEQVHELGHLPQVAHAARDPCGPVADVGFVLVQRAAEMARVTALGAFPIPLSVACGPQFLSVFRKRLHELAARAHRPVVVQGMDHGNGPRRGFEGQAGRKVVQMSDMHDVGANAIEQFGEAPVDLRNAVPIAVARVVDDVKRDAAVVGIPLLAHPVVRRERILLAGEDVDLVAAGEAVAESLRIDFRSRIVAHRVTVDDLKYFHYAAPFRSKIPSSARK